MQSWSKILKIRLRQPIYLGIRSLQVNFGAISTLNEKVVLLTQTEVNGENYEFKIEIKCTS